ncbi:MAG TPA: hypothetical protein ENN79_15730 [Desulfobacteraceae bacterium]|nr:hypothetical protein [Desulfobacteraceae bacterium]
MVVQINPCKLIFLGINIYHESVVDKKAIGRREPGAHPFSIQKSALIGLFEIHFERDCFRMTPRDESFSLFFCGQYLLFIVLDLIAGFSLFGKAIRSLWNRFVCPAEADREDLSDEQT